MQTEKAEQEDQNMLLRNASMIGLMSLMLIPLPAKADMTTKERTISVSAEGATSAVPDQARISIGVVTEAKTAKEALQSNSKSFQAVLAGITQLGIDASDIATQQFQINPIYASQRSSTGRTKNQIDGFRVFNAASITVRRIAQTGDVIDRATELGANNIGAIEFIVSGMEQKLDAARRQAMQNAIRRAKLYAEAAGASLGEILTISEQTNGVPPYRPQMREARMSMAAPIEPGEQTLSVTINSVWKLE
jgi:uncharacterized protein YggE